MSGLLEAMGRGSLQRQMAMIFAEADGHERDEADLGCAAACGIPDESLGAHCQHGGQVWAARARRAPLPAGNPGPSAESGPVKPEEQA